MINRWSGIVVALAVSAAVWWLATGGEHGTTVDVLEVDGGAVDRAVEVPEASPAAVVDGVSPLDVAAPRGVDEPEESDDAAKAREGMVVEVVLP